MQPNIFSVENEKLLYSGEVVGDGESSPGFRQFSFEETALGEGGNGVTYRVRHRVLQVDQVVKLYFPGNVDTADKARLEAIKNADPRVRNVIAQVHDAGTYHFPEKISYSVMESVPGFQTLQEWLADRDAQWEFAQLRAYNDNRFDDVGAQKWKNRRSRTVVAEALNVAAGFVGAVARLHAAKVTHGDLNSSNILILQKVTDPVWSSVDVNKLKKRGLNILNPEYDELRSAHNRYWEQSRGEAQPGTLRPMPVKVIDLGASQAGGTNYKVGIARENWFVLDNLRKILKPLFDKQGSVKNFFLLEQTKLDNIQTFAPPGADAPLEPLQLTSQIFRLICLMNILLGHLHNSRDQDTDVPSEELTLHSSDTSLIWKLTQGELSDIRDNVFSLDVLAVLEVLPESPEKSCVHWQAVWEHWADMHPGFKEYICDS